MKSPLRYPGGKTRAIKYMKDYFPRDMKNLCSPFFGGGSLELFFAKQGVQVTAYDLFEPLVWFWRALLESPKELAEVSDSLRTEDEAFVLKDKRVKGLPKKDFRDIQHKLGEETSYSIANAAMFYALNRSSFSGETLSGGYSKRASYARFTDSSIDRVRDFRTNKLTVECEDFTTSIPKNSDKFLYCDPPYKIKYNLYGKKGNMHRNFNHDALLDLLKNRTDWVLSYNDCEWVREAYKDYEIVRLDWKMGMSNIYSEKERAEKLVSGKKKKMGASSEVLIISK